MPVDADDSLVEALSEREPTGPQGRPASFRLPQIIVEGVLRRSLKSEVITFKLRLLRVVEVTFLVTIPEAGKSRAPVYIRLFLDRSQEDKPGSVVIG